MKQKLLLSAALLCTAFFSGNAQSIFTPPARLQVIEEFTGENCGPCAAYNPGFNAILNGGSNPSKIVAIKYESPIPSPGPVLYAYNKPDVNARMNYYNVPFAPYAVHDGTLFKDNVANFAQSNIDGEVSNAPLYDISVTGAINMNVLTITGTATCISGNITNAVTLHVVLVEDPIQFTTSPGSNGETHFEKVMRKMFPTASGTSVGVPTNGQVTNINFTYNIPLALIQKNLKVVTFVQDDVSKAIYQGHLMVPTLDQCALTTLNSGQTNVKCYNTATGAAYVTLSGGKPPYTYSWSNNATTSSLTGLAAGTYNVTVTDSTGCPKAKTFTLTQPANLSVPMSATSSNGNNGTATVNPIGGTAPFSYKWSDNQTTKTATGLAPGSYSVVVTDANGCSKSNTVTVNAVVTGISDGNANISLGMRPNPATDAVNLEIELANAADLTIMVNNLLGQKVFEKHVTRASRLTETIDVSSFQRGLYFVKVSAGTEEHTLKLSVK